MQNRIQLIYLSMHHVLVLS